MKTIYGDGQYLRVKEDIAEVKVSTGRFKYVPKSEWKLNVRNKKVEEPKVEKVIKTEVVKPKSAKTEKYLQQKNGKKRH